MNDLNEMTKNTTPEQKQKVLACESANEILMLAKSEGIELSAEQAEKILKLITPPYGELSDDELDGIAGGSDKGNDEQTKKCPGCGSTDISRILPQDGEVSASTNCYTLGMEGYPFICNHCQAKFTLYL